MEKLFDISNYQNVLMRRPASAPRPCTYNYFGLPNVVRGSVAKLTSEDTACVVYYLLMIALFPFTRCCVRENSSVALREEDSRRVAVDRILYCPVDDILFDCRTPSR